MLTTTELLAAAITFPVRNLRAESRA
jgi:hypothetical protein